MPRRASAPDHCSIARALDVIGERWTILIIRDAFFGVRHFEGFQASLGIARNVLASRLTTLVDAGILSRVPDADDRRRVVYRLTQKGRDLFPVIMALSDWGTRWETEPGKKEAFVIVDRQTGTPIPPVEVRAADGRALSPRDTLLTAGPGMTEAIAGTIPSLAAWKRA
jgi:DNA-binding HxlR family transcriptional regulator